MKQKIIQIKQSIKSIITNKNYVFTELFLIPSVAIFINFNENIPKNAFLLLLPLIPYTLLINKLKNTTKTNMGLSTKHLIPALKNLIPLTIFIAIIEIWTYTVQPQVFFINGITNNPPKYTLLSVLLYVVISAPIQEFFFRGHIINRLKDISKNPVNQIILSAFIFSSVHFPFNNQSFNFITFFMSIIWAANFIKYQTIYPSIISHAILGLITVKIPFIFEVIK